MACKRFSRCWCLFDEIPKLIIIICCKYFHLINAWMAWNASIRTKYSKYLRYFRHRLTIFTSQKWLNLNPNFSFFVTKNQTFFRLSKWFNKWNRNTNITSKHFTFESIKRWKKCIFKTVKTIQLAHHLSLNQCNKRTRSNPFKNDFTFFGECIRTKSKSTHNCTHNNNPTERRKKKRIKWNLDEKSKTTEHPLQYPFVVCLAASFELC